MKDSTLEILALIVTIISAFYEAFLRMKGHSLMESKSYSVGLVFVLGVIACLYCNFRYKVKKYW